MTVPLLLDEMYPPRLAEALGDKGHDVRAVADSIDLVGSADPVVLDAAREAGRCLVTENVRDFSTLARQTGHAGILLVNSRRWPRTPRGMHALTDALHTLLSEGRTPDTDEVHWLYR